MSKQLSNFNDHDTFMKDLEELSDFEDERIEEDEDDIFTSNNKLENQKQILTEQPTQNSKNYIDSKFTEFMGDIIKNNESFQNSSNIIFDQSRLFTLINECNKYIAELNLEINVTLKSLKQLYSEIFPELTSIIINPYEYTITVKSLISQEDTNKVDLSYLPGNIQLSLNVLLSTHSKKTLSPEKKTNILVTCDKMLTLQMYLKNILKFIENQISFVCPNLTALLGPTVSAKLVTAAGGVAELAKIPASNVLVMGAQKVNTEGFSTKGKLHMGYLAELEEVQNTPEKFKMQALRKYAGKAVLMARVDAFRKPTTTSYFDENEIENEHTTNNITNKQTQNDLPKEGNKFKEQISMKMTKLIEPQQAASKKPLARPDDKPRRKRGGKRIRSIKEKYALTEMRMMKNRMKFGEEAQIEYRESGKGLGLLGVGGTGSKMKTTVKAHKFNTRREKMLALESKNSNGSMNKTTEGITSGLQSSVAFTPAVGIELINPELIDKKFKNVSEKYFSATSGFSTVINQKKKGSSTLYEI